MEIVFNVCCSNIPKWCCTKIFLHEKKIQCLIFYFFPLFYPATDLFSFSRRARVRWSCSLSWCSRWASSICCPQGESWSRAGLEWRRRYWSSSLSPPHRRQHTEPPAHSHQQHKAEPQHGRAENPTQDEQDEDRCYRMRHNETRQDTAGMGYGDTARFTF